MSRGILGCTIVLLIVGVAIGAISPGELGLLALIALLFFASPLIDTVRDATRR